MSIMFIEKIGLFEFQCIFFKFVDNYLIVFVYYIGGGNVYVLIFYGNKKLDLGDDFVFMCFFVLLQIKEKVVYVFDKFQEVYRSMVLDCNKVSGKY